MARKRKPLDPLPPETIRHLNGAIRKVESLSELLEGFKKRIERVVLTQETVDQLVGSIRELKILLEADIRFRKRGN